MAARFYRTGKPLRDALIFALAIQVPLFLLAGLATDGGAIAQICFFAFIAFSSFLFSVLIFRPTTPTKVDLFIIRIGFIPTFFAAFFLCEHIWNLRGF